MKKRKTGICILVWLLCIQGIYAQYVVTAIPPPPQFSHDDLWNLSITRTHTQDNYKQFYISLRIFNGQQQLQVKTNSASIPLPDPVTLINLGNLSYVKPFTMNYYNATVLSQVIAGGGLFPPGVYLVDFTLYGRPSDGEFTELANYNYQAVVDAMWPPMLLSPADGDSIPDPFPVLTWTPAFSTYLQGAVSYSLRLVHIYDGQSKQQAITSNLPHYTAEELPMPLQVYPGSARALEAGQRYAWQVEAYMAGSSLGYSEVWEFCYCTRTPQQQTPGNFFYKLTEHPQSQFETVKGNWLPVAFPEKYVPKEPSLRFRLKNLQGKELANQNNFDAPKKIGMNKYQISLCSDARLDLPEGYYVVEFPTESRITYYLRIHLTERSGCE